MTRIRKKYLILADLMLLNLCYWGMHWLSGEHSIEVPYVKLWAAMNGVWLFHLLQQRRFRHVRLEPLYRSLRNTVLNASYLMFAMAIITVFMRLRAFSSFHIFGTFAAYCAIESLLLVLVKRGRVKTLHKFFQVRARHREEREPTRIFAVDLGLLLLAFFSMHLFKYDTLILDGRAQHALLVVTAAWMITAKWTGKFRHNKETNIYYAQAPYIKAFYIAVAIMSIIVYAVGWFEHSRTLVFGSFLVLLIFELPLVTARVMRRHGAVMGEDIETVEQVKKFIRQRELRVEPSVAAEVSEPAEVALRENEMRDQPELVGYLGEFIPLRSIDRSAMAVVDGQCLSRLKTLERQSLSLFVNMDYINDIRWFNKFFLDVHSKLRSGGYFVLRKRRLENFRDGLETKMPRCLATLVYTIHFVWHRVLPKISGLNKVYFTMSRGRNRVVTRAELIGRLHFCGFRFIKYEHIGDSHWFIVRKVRVPAVDRNPSYGPLITLRRIGYGGKAFQLYKFRTMHPYAEYLQDYVYETSKLDDSGKFKDDFRLTQWGKVMRRYWLDELPQFINYMRGDIRILGVRAISQHYFNLYPADVQQLRTQFKPGLVPPYYADMPRNFEEIVESERRYLTAKKAAPIRTDVVYLCKAMYNILIKKAHSA